MQHYFKIFIVYSLFFFKVCIPSQNDQVKNRSGLKKFFGFDYKEEARRSAMEKNLQSLVRLAQQKVEAQENIDAVAPDSLKRIHDHIALIRRQVMDDSISDYLFEFVYGLLVEHYKDKSKELERLLQSDASKIKNIDDVVKESDPKKKERLVRLLANRGDIELVNGGMSFETRLKLPLADQIRRVYAVLDGLWLDIAPHMVQADEWSYTCCLEWLRRNYPEVFDVTLLLNKDLSKDSYENSCRDMLTDCRKKIVEVLPQGFAQRVIQVKMAREEQKEQERKEIEERAIAAKVARELEETRKKEQQEVMRLQQLERNEMCRMLLQERGNIEAALQQERVSELQTLSEQKRHNYLRTKCIAWFKSAKSLLPIFAINRANARYVEQVRTSRNSLSTIADSSLGVAIEEQIDEVGVVGEPSATVNSSMSKEVTRQARIQRRKEKREDLESKQEWIRAREVAAVTNADIRQVAFQRMLAKYSDRIAEQNTQIAQENEQVRQKNSMQEFFSQWRTWLANKKQLERVPATESIETESGSVVSQVVRYRHNPYDLNQVVYFLS